MKTDAFRRLTPHLDLATMHNESIKDFPNPKDVVYDIEPFSYMVWVKKSMQFLSKDFNIPAIKRIKIIDMPKPYY